MNNQNKDIDLVLRRIFAVLLLGFALFVFKNMTNSNTAILKYRETAVKSIVQINHSATLAKIISSPNTTTVFTSYKYVIDYDIDVCKATSSIIKIHHLLKCREEQFSKIKPLISTFYSYFIRSALNSEDGISVS
ncbi:hypothetical protein TRIP_D390115 [uncultured Paludibacter sp.]|uniref:Uncharacterized protein n=1 Tax=uncultured Paludibacter sp. TaxID=497635 RepID=A0A653AF15_9BACT|nr:hypothetical protein TRIP_D390115 [uncultured Paludibacter sp.]